MPLTPASGHPNHLFFSKLPYSLPNQPFEDRCILRPPHNTRFGEHPASLNASVSFCSDHAPKYFFKNVKLRSGSRVQTTVSNQRFNRLNNSPNFTMNPLSLFADKAEAAVDYLTERRGRNSKADNFNQQDCASLCNETVSAVYPL